MSQPNYLDNVMSRFGHHLSPHQRTNISHSMVPTLQSATPAGYSSVVKNGKVVSGPTLISAPSIIVDGEYKNHQYLKEGN